MTMTGKDIFKGSSRAGQDDLVSVPDKSNDSDFGAVALEYISFLLVVRNEQKRAVECLGSMLDQTLDSSMYEIIVVDGMSIDGTRKAVEEVIAKHPDRAIRLLDNPGKILSSGWNVGIRAARGRYVIRPDAHAVVPRDFLEKNLSAMRAHPDAWAVGGVLKTVGKGFWGEAIASALSTHMGVGGSRFRVGGMPGPVYTVVFGLYSREKLLEVGGFDESIPLNQDNVCHARIHERGGLLYFDPSISSVYYSRGTLRSLWRQMYRRSKWLMLMLKHQATNSLRPRYLAPVTFVLFVMVLAVLGFFWKPFAAAELAVWIAYFTAGWASTATDKLSFLQKLCMPVVFLSMHAAYGVGTLAGLFSLPFYKPKALSTFVPNQ